MNYMQWVDSLFSALNKLKCSDIKEGHEKTQKNEQQNNKLGRKQDYTVHHVKKWLHFDGNLIYDPYINLKMLLYLGGPGCIFTKLQWIVSSPSQSYCDIAKHLPPDKDKK